MLGEFITRTTMARVRCHGGCKTGGGPTPATKIKQEPIGLLWTFNWPIRQFGWTYWERRSIAWWMRPLGRRTVPETLASCRRSNRSMP